MIVAKKIWEHRKNAIWDDGKYFILEHLPTGEKAYFDRTDKVLRVVQRAIKKYGSVGFNKTSGQFCFSSMRKNPIYLSQLLCATYKGKPLSWVRKGRVCFLDKNYHNFTSGNLVPTNENATDNRDRTIYQIGDYIFLYHKSSGRTFFCKYYPGLFELLCNHRIIWRYLDNQNKLQANIMRKGQIIPDLMPYFHQVVYAFEHYGATANNFIGKIREMQDDLEKRELTIDHLDGNQENAMPWNLSLMSRSQNSAKKDMLGRVRYPFFLFSVYCDGKYRIYCGRIRDLIAGVLDYNCWICETPDDLIDFMKNFLSKEWEDGLSPAKNVEENPNAVCYQNYFGDFGASGIRDELMAMSEDNLDVWKAEVN